MNRLLQHLGIDVTFTSTELRLATTGMNFRATATAIAADHGSVLAADELERWVAIEREVVTSHLQRRLAPDPAVTGALTRLFGLYALAVVSSSASERVGASLAASGIAEFFPGPFRFSAEDSLAVPASKPDPAIYQHALESLGISTDHALAIEDAVPGVEAAVRAGVGVIGMLAFVASDERAERAAALEAAGARAAVSSWRELEGVLG